MDTTQLSPEHTQLHQAALEFVNEVRSALHLSSLTKLQGSLSLPDRCNGCPVAASIMHGEDLLEAHVTSTTVCITDWDSGICEIYRNEDVPDDVARFIELADEGVWPETNTGTHFAPCS